MTIWKTRFLEATPLCPQWAQFCRQKNPRSCRVTIKRNTWHWHKSSRTTVSSFKYGTLTLIVQRDSILNMETQMPRRSQQIDSGSLLDHLRIRMVNLTTRLRNLMPSNLEESASGWKTSDVSKWTWPRKSCIIRSWKRHKLWKLPKISSKYQYCMLCWFYTLIRDSEEQL